MEVLAASRSVQVDQRVRLLPPRDADANVDGVVHRYHAGDGAWTEIDVMLDEDAKVGMAHDVAETLQYCCEGDRLPPVDWLRRSRRVIGRAGLQEVDRAFVTVDCELSFIPSNGPSLTSSASDTSQGPTGHVPVS